MKRAAVVTFGLVWCSPLCALLALGCSAETPTPGSNTDETDTSATSARGPASASTEGDPSEPGGTKPGPTTSSPRPSPTPTTNTDGEPAGTSEPPDATDPVVTSEGSSEPAPTTSAPSGETSGPPDGAYVPCSGAALPALDVEPVLLPPKVNMPIYVQNPKGQPNMFYVVERDGAFKRFDLSQSDPAATTLVTLSGVSTSGEMGFLSAALHPNFDGENEKRAYLLYTPAQSFVLEEYTIEGDTAVKGEILFQFTGDTESNHNGGLALFGPDGYLYVGIGDGGGGNDQHGDNGNGQNTNTTYGKILRLDVDAPEEPVAGNLTSADVGGEMVDGRILHYGVRNPWRFSFDRLTDDLWIGDVGQNAWEEVDYLPADAGPTNFGWAAREGLHECGACGATLVGLPAVEPVYEYENPAGNQESRSVTGGYVYRGNALPGLYGRYLFADYQTGVFYTVTANGAGPACDVEVDAVEQNQMRATGIASFAEGVDGELYVIHLNDGIFKIVPKQ